MKILVAILLALALVFSAAPAQAVTFGDTARAVAAEIDCTDFTPLPRQALAGTLSANLSAGDCTLDGRRITILTFPGPVRQNRWHDAMVEQFDPGYFWAEAPGVAMGGFAGWFMNAETAASRLDGQVFHGTHTF